MSSLPDDYERVAVPPRRDWHTWVLSDHYERTYSAQPRRTYLGELVYRAKYLDERAALDELKNAVRHCALQLRAFPDRTDGLGTVTAVAAVPCNPAKRRSVPHELAAAVASRLGLRDVSSNLIKVHATPPAKTAPASRPDAYTFRGRLDGESILLVDDLYHTGTTMESVASRLRSAGASHVVGLCVTKAHRGMTQ